MDYSEMVAITGGYIGAVITSIKMSARHTKKSCGKCDDVTARVDRLEEKLERRLDAGSATMRELSEQQHQTAIMMERITADLRVISAQLSANQLLTNSEIKHIKEMSTQSDTIRRMPTDYI